MLYPGRRWQKATKIMFACVLIFLTSIGGILPVLPEMFGTSIADVSPGSLTKSNPARNTVAPEPPGIPLPAGTISYGTKAQPSMNQAVDSSISPHLVATKNGFIYQTSYGMYSFNRTAPYLFSLSSRSGTQLTKMGFFFVNSTITLSPGSSTVTSATDTELQVKYSVLASEITVGNLFLDVAFQRSIAPKFTISFVKTPLSALGEYNIVWLTFTAQRWLKPSSSSVVDIQRSKTLASIANVLRADTGPETDANSWREWFTTDWTDAGSGLLKVGFLTLGGYSDYGHVVVFAKNIAKIDPTQVSSSTASFATAYSTQRKTFNYGGYYFLFFYDGNNIVYQKSQDGNHWSPTFIGVNGPISSYSFDLYQSGMNLALGWLNYNSGAGGDGTTQLLFRKGTIVGSSISWISVATVASWSQPYSWPPSVAITSDGTYWAAGIWQDGSSKYNVWIYKSPDGSNGSFSLSTNYYTSNNSLRSEALQLIPMAQGQLMSLTSHYSDSTIRSSIYYPIGASGPYWASIQSFNVYLSSNLNKWNIVSAIYASDSLVHVLTASPVADVSYNLTSNQWTYGTTLTSSGSTVYPTISADNLGNLHAFYYDSALGGSSWYAMKPKWQPWQGSIQIFGSGSQITNSAWISVSRSSTRDVPVVWTLGTSSPYKIMFGSVPLPSGIASGPPGRPWSRLGLSPSEQYFTENGESVSPGNGLLTVTQTDVSVNGRNGLNLAIGRLYTQPFTFISSSGAPFNFEGQGTVGNGAPYAALGNGWWLNLPWIGSQYLHLANGELFPLAWTTYNSTTQGVHVIQTWTLENHQTEDFSLSEKLDTNTSTHTTTTTFVLITKDGTVYNFAVNDFRGFGVLTSIVDRTGQNQITFAYTLLPNTSIMGLASITDPIGRNAYFNYDSNNRLFSVAYGSQTLIYSYTGSNPNSYLATVRDTVGLTTSFNYATFQNSWLLNNITYPTGGYSKYNFTATHIGTDATNYYVVLHNVYTPGSVVKSSSFSYNITDGEITYTSVKQSDGQNVQGYTNYAFNIPSSSMTRTVLNATLMQMLSQRFWYDPISGRSVQQDVFSGPSTVRSFYNTQSYDSWGNVIYNRDNIGHESFQSFANSNTQWTLQGLGSLITSTDGKQLYDDFNGPGLNSTSWITGGSAASQTFNVANSLLNMTAKAATYGSWSSMWARSTNTYNYPFNAEVQMALGQNPCSYCEAAELVISPQLTGSTGDPFNNNDALRVMIYDGVHYDIIKNVGGIQSTLLDASAGATWSVSWKIVLTDRNTMTVYLNRGWGGSGFVQVYSTTTLGLSTSFTPAYVYVIYRTTRANLYSASFDYVGLTSGNTLTVSNLQSGQNVRLYDWNNNLQASATVPTGQTSIALDATQMVFPYGYFQVSEVDGRTTQFTSATREIYGGSTYAYRSPFRSGGTTRTSTGFLGSSSVYVDDSLPSGATSGSDGGDTWVWATSSYAPVVRGSQSHMGLVASGEHQHFFYGATTTISPSSGTFLVQYVYVPSTTLPGEIMVQFHDTGGSWEHRAYWGRDLIIQWGTNGTSSRRSMGPLPSTINTWIMLIVKADDVNVNGLTLDGWAYTLYDGGAYWDYSALGASSTGTVTINNLQVGQKVEVYDAKGSLKTSATVSSGFSISLNLYSANVNAFPFQGSMKVYATNGALQYAGPMMNDVWGGDTYTYNQPVFSNKFNSGTPATSIHNLQIGEAQYQNATSTLEETYSNFDATGNLLRRSQMHNGLSLNTTNTYDIFGNILSTINPIGEITYTKYSHGNAYASNVTRILGTNTPVTRLYEYSDSTGMMTSITDPRGNTTRINYDSIDRVTLLNETVTTGLQKLVTIVYNDSRNNFTVTNEKGNVTLFKVDPLGRSNSTRAYKSGNSQTLATQNVTYTWLNEAKIVTRSDGNRTTYAYDYLGRLVQTTNPDGSFKITVYDNVNLIQSNYDENGHRTGKLYDPMQRLIGVREYYSATNYYLTSYTYDGIGNLAKAVDGKGQVTTYTHDDLNRLITTVYPDGYNETRTYDNVGNLQGKRDPNGNTISYSYDTLNRLTTIGYPNNTIASYGYDKNNNRVSLSYLGNIATFKYDAWNRVTNETWTIGGVPYSLRYGYDSVGNLVALTYPDGTRIGYSIDPLNNVANVTNLSTSTRLASITYSAGNRIASITYGTGSSGQTTTYSYDSRNRPTRVKTLNSTATLLDLNYTYDAVGNVVGINSEHYSYDSLNRLTKTNATGLWGVIQYGYDAVGNRVWMAQPGNTTYTYGPYNRLTSVGSSTYSYDNNGNLKTSANSAYNYYYDYENRLTRIQQFSSTIGTYVYSPLGQRIQKTENGITTVYVNQDVNVLYENQTTGGNLVNDYVYDNGLLLAKISGGNVYYFHTDLLGNVRLVTKGSGTNFSSNYQPFGSQYGASGSDPTYKYTGKPQDQATGLYYYGARYYDASGRFISRDPARSDSSDPQTGNPYVYARSNPEKYRDPTGACLDACGLAEDVLSFFASLFGFYTLQYDDPSGWYTLILNIMNDWGPSTYLDLLHNDLNALFTDAIEPVLQTAVTGIVNLAVANARKSILSALLTGGTLLVDTVDFEVNFVLSLASFTTAIVWQLGGGLDYQNPKSRGLCDQFWEAPSSVQLLGYFGKFASPTLAPWHPHSNGRFGLYSM